MAQDSKIRIYGISITRLIAVLATIIFIYSSCFLLIFYDFNLPFLDNSSTFLTKLVNTFLGGGAIATITAILLIFQDHIQSKQEKKKEIFDKKLKLYEDIIDDMNNYFKPKDNEHGAPKIDEQEKLNLFFSQMKVLLLSNVETASSFSDMIQEITNDEGKIKESSYFIFMDFVKEAREDLDVQDKMTPKQQQIFNRMIENIKTEAKNVATGGRTFFSDFDEWFKTIQNGQKSDLDVTPPIKEIKARKLSDTIKLQTRDLHNKIKSIISIENEDFEITYSPTGGCSFSVKNKKMGQINPLPTYLEILTLRDFKNDYKNPTIEGLDIGNCRKYDNTGKSNWGYNMYKIKVKYDNLAPNLDKITELIKSSYQTLQNDKVLNVSSKDWSTRWEKDLKNILS